MKILLLWLVNGLIVGSLWYFMKLGLTQIPPFSLAAMRLLIAIPILGMWVKKSNVTWPLNKHEWLTYLGTGIAIFFVNISLVFWATQYLDIGVSSMIFNSMPIFTIIFVYFLLPDEHIGIKKLLTLVLGISGVYLIYSFKKIDSNIEHIALIAIVFCAAIIALSSVLIKKLKSKTSPHVVAFIQTTSGFIPLLFLALFIEGIPNLSQWSSQSWFSVVFLAIAGNCLALVLFYWLLERIDVFDIQLLPLWGTCVTLLEGYFLLNEKYSYITWIGGGLIVTGLIIVLPWKTRRSTT